MKNLFIAVIVTFFAIIAYQGFNAASHIGSIGQSRVQVVDSIN